MSAQYSFDRSRLIYELIVRQEPKQARMCGVGGKADRRPIDPPPIVQLRVLDPALQSSNAVAGPSKSTRRDNNNGSDADSPGPRPFTDDVPDPATYSQSFLQNPYFFMFACLARPDDDAELHWLKDGRTRSTTGSVVSSLYHLKDPQNHNEDAGFFVFPDLSVRTEGSYRLKLSLYEVVGNNVHHCKSIYSAPFYVYTAKKFPGMEESTPLSCSLADQGIKIRIRKDIRVRKRQIPALTQPLATDVDIGDTDGDDEEDPGRSRRQAKRSRIDNSDAGASGLPTVGTAQRWPPLASINPSLGPTIPPPPAAPPNSLPSSSSGVVIPPPPKPGREMPPVNGVAMGVHVPPGSSLPGPSVFDGRGGGIIQADPPQQSKSPQSNNSTAQQYRESSQVDAAASSSPQMSSSSPQAHPQYPAPSSPVAPAPAAPPQQQAIQPQHHTPNSLTNATGPPQPVAAPPPSTHGPPPAMQHQPQHPQQQHMQHQTNSYVPPPYSQWGPTPMAAPAQPAVYDPYYHHQQHTHYTTYAPPPQQPLPPPPPPARYDYGTGMYSHAQAPPPMPSYGYYDQHQHQHQQHHQPPPQQQMIPPHPHSYPQQHQVHPPPPMHQYAAPPPPAPASTNPTTSAGAPMVTDPTQIGNGTNGTTTTQQQPPPPPPTNFASSSGVAATSTNTQYDYGAGTMVYNNNHNRPPIESSAAARGGGYGAPTPGPAPPGQYGMTPMHPPPQGYPMHAAGGGSAPPHPNVSQMRHSPYGPPPPPPPHHPHAPHPHPGYSYTPYNPPPPPAPEWGGQGFVANHHHHQHGWDAYAHHSQHLQQQQQQQQAHVPVGQPHPQTSVVSTTTAAGGGGGGGAVEQGHRIQLAPIPSTDGNGNGNNNPSGVQNAVSPTIQQQQQQHQHQSPVRTSNSSNSSPPTTAAIRTNGRVTMSNGAVVVQGERVDDVGYSSQAKKNPLSIGSIISK